MVAAGGELEAAASSQADFAERQFADALAGCRKNRVAKSGSEWWNAGFTDARGCSFARNEMDVCLARGDIHAGHGVAVEVGLLDDAVLRGDFAVKREARAEDGRAFKLLNRHFGIHDSAGVH